ncbi:MAG: hypothetical protein HZB09_00345, partial [Candidatus Yonathbacteria bacterium]|nr:hypothetical protein [Candidatus Yonathbacteria bacterium]
HILAINNRNEQAAFKAVSWAIAVSIAAYGILAMGMVFNTVDRSNFEKEMRSLYSQVGKLEGDYITRTTTIDLSFAHSNGFQDASQVKFTTRNTVVGIRTALHNEI